MVPFDTTPGVALTSTPPQSPMPARIQLRRTPGWRKPAGAISVARPGRWGNPFRLDHTLGLWRVTSPDGILYDTTPTKTDAAQVAVDLYRMALTSGQPTPLPDPWLIHDLGELRGRDLACWCRLGDPCHADVLLELANLPALALLDLDETATAALMPPCQTHSTASHRPAAAHPEQAITELGRWQA